MASSVSGQGEPNPAKKWPKKAALDRNEMNKEKLLILEFLIKELFELELPDVK